MTSPLPASAGTRDVDVLAGWVRSRVDELASNATGAIWGEVSAYHQHADSTLKAEVAAHCRQVFQAFLRSVDDRRDPARGDFPWTGRHAMRRVDLGISLPDFMQAFRVGQITLWDDILEGVRAHPETKDAALLIVNQVMRTIEVGSTAAAESYLEAQQFKAADGARVERDLLEDLLAGKSPRVEPRLALLKSSGLAEDTPLVVATGHLVGHETESDNRHAMVLARTALEQTGPGFVVIRHSELVAVLPVLPGEEEAVIGRVQRAVTALAGRSVFTSVGVSTPRHGFGEIPQAYEEACLARRSLTGEVGVRSLAKMSTLDYFVQCHDATALRLVRPEVRSFVLEDLAGDGTYVETLKQYVACDLNAKVAAMALHVHANTVYYRLERIAERTGCDLRKVEELIDLLLAVRLVRSES